MWLIDPKILEQAGWFLVYSFLLGLAFLPVVWLAKVLTRRLRDSVRSVVALGTLTTVAFAPLVGACWLSVTSAPTEQPLRTMAGVRYVPDAQTVGIGTPGELSTEIATELSTIASRSILDTPPLFAADEIPTNNVPPSRPAWSHVMALPIVWLAGSTLTACFLALGLVGSVRLRFQSIALDAPMQRIVDEVLDNIVGSRVTVRLCDAINSPILLGIIRPIILLPCTATGWPPDTVRFVVLHELAHARRWDNLVNLVQRVVEAACFYQPAVWIASAWVRAEREICCDRFVAEVTDRPAEYARALVQLATEQSNRRSLAADHVTCSSTRHALVTRVARLLGKEETMRIQFRTLLLSLTALGLMGAVTYGTVFAPVQEKNSTDASKQAEPEAAVAAEELSEETQSSNDRSTVMGQQQDQTPVLETDQLRLELIKNGIVSTERAGVFDSFVKVGDRVKRGEVLGQLRMTTEKAAVNRLLKQSESDIEVRYAKASNAAAKQRYRAALAKRKAFSDAELMNLQLEWKKTELDVEKAQVNRELLTSELKEMQEILKLGRLIATTGGTVTVAAESGSAAKPGQEIFRVSNLKQLSCVFSVPLADLSKVEKGMRVKFLPSQEGFPEAIGSIRYVGSLVSSVSQAVDVLAVLETPTEQVRAGQRGRLQVFAQKAPKLQAGRNVATEPEPVQSTTGKATELTIKQRKSKLVPGTNLRISIDDITAGQVLISITDGSNVVLDKSLKLGDVAAFTIDGETQYVRVRQLTNLLIGEDFAVLEVASKQEHFTKDAPKIQPADEDPQDRGKV